MSHSAAFFQSMLADFRCLPDYTLDHRIYLAADYGVPQMRERIFIIGMKEPKVFRPPLAMPTHMSAQEALQDLEERPEDRGISHIWSRAKLSPGQGSRKLTAHLPSSTIRAESHGNQQWHYYLPRRISLREAVRLQSFPDDFVFPGGMRESERQIGNAVPPVLMWHIAKALYDQLHT